MSIARKYSLGFVVLLIVLYFGVINIVVPSYLTAAIPTLETIATNYINGKVNIGELNVSNTLELTAKNITVSDKSGTEIAHAPSVVIGFSFFKGLAGYSVVSAISNISVNDPVLRVNMDASDKWNIDNLIKETKEKGTVFKGLVHISNGQLIMTTPYGKWTAGVQGDIDAAGNPSYAVDLDVFLRNETLSIVGKINKDRIGALTIKTESFGLDDFTAFIEHYIPVQNMSGSIKDMSILWHNDGGTVGMSGTGKFFQAAGTVVNGNAKIPLTLDGRVNFHEMSIKADKLAVTVNGEKAEITGNLDFTNRENPVAEDLSIKLENFDLSKVVAASPVVGAVSGTLVLNGTQKNILVKGNLTAPILNIEGETLTDVTIPLSMKDEKIIITGAGAKYSGGEISLVGTYEQTDSKILATVGLKHVDIAPLAQLSNESIIADGDVALEGSFAKGNLKVNTSANFMTLTWRGAVFKNLDVDVDINKDAIIINNFSGFSDNGGAMVAKGSVINNVIDAKVRISNLPIGPFLQLAQKNGYGTLSGEFAVHGPVHTASIEGIAALGAGELFGQKFTEAHGFLAFHDDVLKIKNWQLTMLQGEHLVDGFIDFSGIEAVADINLTTNNVRMDPISDFFAPEVKLTGNLTNTAHISGPLNNLTIVGKIHAWDGSCKKFLVDDIAGEYSYDKGILTLQGFKIKTLTTSIDLDGTMDAAGNLNFVMDARQIHLARIPQISNYADVEGMADFSGKVKGTKSLPMFAGVLTSNAIKINGEELTGLAFFLESSGGTRNKLNGTFHQTAGGDYEASLLLDLSEGLLQGTLNVTGGNVKSLLKMTKEEFAMEGSLDGKIIINKDGKGSGISVTGKVNKSNIRGVPFKDIGFDLFYKRGLWQIKNLKAEEEAGGFMAAQGMVDLKSRKIDLEVGCNKVNAAILTAFMANPIDFGGQMDFTAQLTGNLDNPNGNISLQVTQGKVAGISFDNLYGMVTLRDDVFKLEQLFLEKDVYKVSAYGTFPEDLLRAKDNRRNPDAQMDLSVRLDNANLAILPSLTKWIDWAVGDTKGNVDIGGTLEDPRVNGSVLIDKGTIKIKEMATLLDNFKMEVNFKGNQVILKELSSNIGKEGRVVVHGNFVFADRDNAPYLLDFDAKKVQIESTYFNGIINANGKVEQKRNRPQLTSTIRLDNVLLNIPGIPDMDQGSSNIGLDVTLELGPNIHLRNKYMYDLWLAGGIHITGSTKFTNVDGSIDATKGTISYIRTPFNIKRASVAWPIPGSIMPSVSFEATSRFSRYNITAKADGPVDEMNVSLTSNPAKSQTELLRMLTLKTTDDNSNSSVNNANVQGLLDAGLQMTFMGDIEDFVKQTFAFDEFRIYNGNVRSSIGFDIDALKAENFTNEDRNQYNVLISKRFMKNALVGYSTSFDREYHSVFAEYDITDKLNLNFSKDEKNRRWYGIQYQISF